MKKITPVIGANLAAISRPVAYGGTTQTVKKGNAAMSVDAYIRLSAAVVTYNLIFWIATGPLPADGFWVVHPAADVALAFAGVKSGQDWQRFTANDTPCEVGVWLPSGNVADVAEAWLDPCNRVS